MKNKKTLILIIFIAVASFIALIFGVINIINNKEDNNTNNNEESEIRTCKYNEDYLLKVTYTCSDDIKQNEFKIFTNEKSMKENLIKNTTTNTEKLELDFDKYDYVLAFNKTNYPDTKFNNIIIKNSELIIETIPYSENGDVLKCMTTTGYLFKIDKNTEIKNVIFKVIDDPCKDFK